MNTHTGLGERLRGLRSRKAVRQRDVAFALDVAEGHVSKWESETCKPNFQNCCMLADYFGVTVDFLMTGREPEAVPVGED